MNLIPRLEFGFFVIFLIGLTSAAVTPQSQAKPDIKIRSSAAANAAVEYKYAFFNISTTSESVFRIVDTEIANGKWFKLKPCMDATEQEINALTISKSQMAFFGGCGRAYLPEGPSGFIHIALDNGTKLTKIFFQVPYVGSNAIIVKNLSPDKNHKCVVTEQDFQDNSITVLLSCE